MYKIFLITKFFSQDGVRFQSEIQQASMLLEGYQSKSRIFLSLFSISASLIGVIIVLKKINPQYRARNQFENTISKLLMTSSLVAIFTTIGIVLSVFI